VVRAPNNRSLFLHRVGALVPHAVTAAESQYVRDLHYLKVYAYRIRRKLGDEGGHILQSDPSVGYRLLPPGP
jgi:DNA-binding response OmpR family regulator